MSVITIKELAKLLNLSISTVSRALSNSYEISDSTRKKVQALAEELNYKPNLYASNLRSRKSKTIAVIIPEVANSFFALAIDGIEEIAHKNGYHVLIYITHDDHVREVGMITHLLNGRVDGILMSVASASNDTAHIELLKKYNIPLVFFDRVCDKIDTLKVVTDDYKSGLKAGNHLISRGCKNIVYLSFSENLSIDLKRKKGCQDACEKAGIIFQVLECSQNEKENKNLLAKALRGKDRPDGIFASVEKLAISLYETCDDLKIAIPQQLKIISFSNLKVASLLNPPLTTITQPAFEIGKKAALGLFGALKHNTVLEASELMIASALVERESTR